MIVDPLEINKSSGAREMFRRGKGKGMYVIKLVDRNDPFMASSLHQTNSVDLQVLTRQAHNITDLPPSLPLLRPLTPLRK